MAGQAMKTARRAVVAPAAKAPARRRVVVEEGEEGSGQASTYFSNIEERKDLKFVKTGCALLDAALGGGWVLGRTANIVGDKSAGKTLLAIEACANFAKDYADGVIRYNEQEAAFDESYAEALGMPIARIDFKGKPLTDKEKKDNKALNTVERLHEDLEWVMDENKGRPILYVVDSLDAISDEAEQGREIGDSSYGGSKPKKIGEMFRRLIDRMEEQQVLLLVISQLRDKLNVTFGEKQTRSGGRALDFYASHIVWLAEIGKLKRTIDKVERAIGVNVKARVKKNKVGLPFRECEYPILFGYGVDDLTANVEWLIEVGSEKRLDEVELSKGGYKVSLNNVRDKGGPRAREMRKKLAAIVWEEWQRIETGFLPKASKY